MTNILLVYSSSYATQTGINQVVTSYGTVPVATPGVAYAPAVAAAPVIAQAAPVVAHAHVKAPLAYYG